MKVKELIEELSKYDPEMEVWDYTMNSVNEVWQSHWIDPNYPWKDEKDIIIIE